MKCYTEPTTTFYSNPEPEVIVAQKNFYGLADGEFAVVSDLIQAGDDNALKTMGSFYMAIGEQPADRMEGGSILLYILPAWDVQGFTAMPNINGACIKNYLARQAWVDAGREERRLPFHHVILPNGQFYIGVENRTGAPFSDEYNSIRAQFYSFTSV